MEHRTPPQHLYKYRNLVGESRAHLERVFTHCELFYASPLSFNDPFDCRVHMAFPENAFAFRKYMVGLLKKFEPQLNRQQRMAKAAAIIRDRQPHRNEEFQRAVLNDAQNDVNGLGVFCLCERPDDILMWSHYADGHMGACLEFENRVGLGIPLDVKYSESLPKVDFLRDSHRDQVEANLLTKASRWSYEREWRVLDTEKGPGIRTFPPNFLSGVIFGCRMPLEDREAVVGWIRSGPTRPVLMEAVVVAGSYELAIQPLLER